MKNQKKYKILLIGKYPPMQGGVASKTYWLYEQLEKNYFEFQIITTYVENYSSYENRKEKFTHYVNCKDIPWHIPDSNLYFERLLNVSLEVIDEFIPDIIETNYLWPYCGVASYLANYFKKPLLIRHAGSDIQKFYKDIKFSSTLKRYFEHADLIITNNKSQRIINKLCIDKSKVKITDRYIPNPDFFYKKKSEKKYDILFVGKINYFWNLKGIEYLLKFIKSDNLKALFVVDGKYVEEIYSIIANDKLKEKIDFLRFQHPGEMPEIINQCKSVWCWEEKNNIEDFSNLILEAYYCNVPCFISSHTKSKNDLKVFLKSNPDLIISIDPLKTKSLIHYISETDFIESGFKNSLQKSIFTNYINQNIGFYHTILKKTK